jgi:flagellar hook-length control protein FliK
MNVSLTDIKLTATPIPHTKAAPKTDVTKAADNEDFRSMMKKTLNSESGNKPQLVENTKIKKMAGDLIVDVELPLEAGLAPDSWLKTLDIKDIDISTDVTLMTQTGDESAISEHLSNIETTIIIVPNSNAMINALPVVGENLPANGNSLPLLADQKVSVGPITNNRIKSLQQAPRVDRVVQNITEGLNTRGVTSDSAQFNSNAQFMNSDFFDSLTTKTFEPNALQHLGSDSSSTRLQAAMATMNGLQNPSANQSTANPVSTSVLSNNLDRMVMTNPDSSAEWSSGLGERVSVMLNQKQHLATIRLDPPMLGKMDIQIQVKDDVTNVTINTQHAQTRDMVDSASHRLREILQDAGYQNVNVDVSHQSDHQKNDTQFMDNSDSNDGLDSGVASSADELSMTTQITLPDSLVDFFA